MSLEAEIATRLQRLDELRAASDYRGYTAQVCVDLLGAEDSRLRAHAVAEDLTRWTRVKVLLQTAAVSTEWIESVRALWPAKKGE